MSDVTVITPPDKLFDQATKILLITPGVEIRKTVGDILANTPRAVNIFLYEEEHGLHVEWVLDILAECNICIIDVDNSSEMIKKFASLIIANPKTFYLTNDSVTPYNLISANRVYDMHWLDRFLKED
jgi:hypothetical protein